MKTNVHHSFKSDYDFGIAQENIQQQRLEEYFESPFKKQSRFSKYDYRDTNGVVYELKSRKCKKNTYPTTFIPIHKVIQGENQVFVFNFTDELCYIRYDDSFKSYETIDLDDWRTGNVVTHYQIPVGALVSI